ncbi:MAG: acyl--CoA ligase [Elusimicrobia bacterium]|nr:acyl--CoA ligase [Elusimicrobiota bacterium]
MSRSGRPPAFPPPGHTLQEALLSHLDRRRDRPFLIDTTAGRTFTYGEFHGAACGLAGSLRGMGLSRGDRVAAVLNNSAEFAALYFACLYLGVTAVPVNPWLHPNDVAFILANCGASALALGPATEALVPLEVIARLRDRLLCLPAPGETASPSAATAWSAAAPGEPPAAWTPLDGVVQGDLFSITFTSGTTSRPKGVPQAVGSLLPCAASFNDLLGFGPDHCFYHVLPMSYMAGFLNMLLCPFLAGASVVLSRGFDACMALDFWKSPMRHGADSMWLVPSMLSALLRVDRDDAGRAYCREQVRAICVGTAPLAAAVKREFEARYGATLMESYGLSETLFVSGNSGTFPQRPGSVGKLLAEVEVKTVADDGRDLPPGAEGEILIKTPFMMSGYLDYDTLRPGEAPAEWFPSGDIGRLDSEGYLFITGRKKDLIIRGGVNISPRAVEDVILGHEAVAGAAVVGAPDELYGESVAAFVKLKPGRMLAEALPSLQELCRRSLTALAVPGRFIELSEFPVNATGKVQKRDLKARLSSPRS